MQTVERRSALSYEQFLDEYMLPNRPVILTDIASVERGWKCMDTWTKEKMPDFDFLATLLSHCSAPVVDCGKGGYGEQEQNVASVGEFLRGWEAELQEETPGTVGNNGEGQYLKDWHFRKEFPKIAENTYRTPSAFQDDWLNWWCDKKGLDDFRFVYMGKEGTWTPLHHDVLCSYSWSVNVCGLKRWILFPPPLTPCLYSEPRRNSGADEIGAEGTFGEDEFDWYLQGELLQDIRAMGIDGEDTADGASGVRDDPAQEPALWPRWKEAYDGRVEVLQHAGEAIFVPSGWHHQVHNLRPTISINHNWFNGACLQRVWRFLKMELVAVRREICHLRSSMNSSANSANSVDSVNSVNSAISGNIFDSGNSDSGTDGTAGGRSWDWERQCELIMKANSGINLEEFLTLLHQKAHDFRVAIEQIYSTGSVGGEEEEGGAKESSACNETGEMAMALPLSALVHGLEQVELVLEDMRRDPFVSKCL
jgi:hypothetical protein